MRMQDNHFCSQEHLGKIVGDTHVAMVKHLSKILKENDIPITPDQFRVLMYLWQQDGKSQQELAVLSCRDRANVTRIIDILEREGVVERQDDENDRRIFKIHLTEFGKTLESQTLECVQKSTEDALQGINPSDLEICIKVLKKIAENLH
jgi:MarR family transcriptional regulator, organic hydroperoxide resistance regulator